MCDVLNQGSPGAAVDPLCATGLASALPDLGPGVPLWNLLNCSCRLQSDV